MVWRRGLLGVAYRSRHKIMSPRVSGFKPFDKTRTTVLFQVLSDVMMRIGSKP